MQSNQNIINDFVKSNESIITLKKLPSNERKELHQICDDLNLYHISILENNEKILIISKDSNLVETYFQNDKQRTFIRDSQVPIPECCEDKFKYFIDLLDPFYDTKLKYQQFELCLEKFEGLKLYKKYIGDLTRHILESIKTNPEYTKFLNEKININLPLINKKGIYNHNYHNKYFISIDIKKANFNSLKLMYPQIFNKIVDINENFEWKDILKTNLEFIVNNKRLRQQIFGLLNPKRFAKLYLQITYQIYNTLQEKNNYQIICLKNDEIIILTNESNIEKDYNDINLLLQNKLQSIYKILNIEKFKLIKLENKVFIKQKYTDNGIKFNFKCVNAEQIEDSIKLFDKMNLNNTNIADHIIN